MKNDGQIQEAVLIEKRVESERERLNELENNEQMEKYEIEELQEVLDAEIENKELEIQKAEEDIKKKNVNIDFNEVTGISEAKILLKKYFYKIIELKGTEMDLYKKIEETQVYLDEQQRINKNLHNNVRLTEMMYEKKILKIQKQNDLRMQYLLQKMNEKIDKNVDAVIEKLKMKNSHLIRENETIKSELQDIKQNNNVEKSDVNFEIMELKKRLNTLEEENKNLKFIISKKKLNLKTSRENVSQIFRELSREEIVKRRQSELENNNL